MFVVVDHRDACDLSGSPLRFFGTMRVRSMCADVVPKDQLPLKYKPTSTMHIYMLGLHVACIYICIQMYLYVHLHAACKPDCMKAYLTLRPSIFDRRFGQPAVSARARAHQSHAHHVLCQSDVIIRKRG